MKPKALIQVCFVRDGIGIPEAYMDAPQLPNGVCWAVGTFIDIPSEDEEIEGFFESIDAIQIDRDGNTKIVIDYKYSGPEEELREWFTQLGFQFGYR